LFLGCIMAIEFTVPSIKLDQEIDMNTKTEGIIAIIAALLVLFSAMWDPRVSIAVSFIALTGFGIYKFVHKNG
jgi:hypothetical protein